MTIYMRNVYVQESFVLNFKPNIHITFCQRLFVYNKSDIIYWIKTVLGLRRIKIEIEPRLRETATPRLRCHSYNL